MIDRHGAILYEEGLEERIEMLETALQMVLESDTLEEAQKIASDFV